ncbi:hypothetical protein [Streptomyces sp. NPDC059466]|uniref:hypothetical protein n=1 Tax=unclassified Streptomyces TaxID=2593676 RepID=UPI0036BA146F
MRAAIFTTGPFVGSAALGATALSLGHHRHLLGNALRAVKVFAGAVLDVVILGEYGEEAGVRHR